MITVVFIRHGAVKGNTEKRYIGRTDEPLCSTGICQAMKLREQNFKADRIFVSPMLRARQTAELAFPKIPYRTIENLTEMDFGVFEGRTADELAENKDYTNWVNSMCTSPIPDGERLEDFKRRCCIGFTEAVQGLPDNSAAVFVVHGGVIMAVLEKYAVPSHGFYDYHIENGEYIVCELENSCITAKQPVLKII